MRTIVSFCSGVLLAMSCWPYTIDCTTWPWRATIVATQASCLLSTIAFMPASRRLRRSLEKPTASGLVSGTLTLRACAAPMPRHRTRATNSEDPQKENREVRTVKSPLAIAGQNNLSDAVPALHDRSLPCPPLSSVRSANSGENQCSTRECDWSQAPCLAQLCARRRLSQIQIY